MKWSHLLTIIIGILLGFFFTFPGSQKRFKVNEKSFEELQALWKKAIQKTNKELRPGNDIEVSIGYSFQGSDRIKKRSYQEMQDLLKQAVEEIPDRQKKKDRK